MAYLQELPGRSITFFLPLTLLVRLCSMDMHAAGPLRVLCQSLLSLAGCRCEGCEAAGAPEPLEQSD